MKRFQIVQHNSWINSRHVITKKKCQIHWISSHSFNRFGPFQARSELQQENRTGSWERVWGAGIYIVAHGIPLIIVQLKYLHKVLFHIPRPASHVESLADDTWNQLLSGTYNLWMILLCPDLVTPQVPGEKERESRQFYEIFPVFELILYLQGRHEYSSKHSTPSSASASK